MADKDRAKTDVPSPDLDATLVGVPEPIGVSQVSETLEAAKLGALSGGAVIAGPLQHDGGCGGKGTLYVFAGKTTGHFSIQNLGQCAVRISVDGKRKLLLPAAPRGHTGAGFEFEGQTLEFQCAKGNGRCKFLWVIRR